MALEPGSLVVSIRPGVHVPGVPLAELASSQALGEWVPSTTQPGPSPSLPWCQWPSNPQSFILQMQVLVSCRGPWERAILSWAL